MLVHLIIGIIFYNRLNIPDELQELRQPALTSNTSLNIFNNLFSSLSKLI